MKKYLLAIVILLSFVVGCSQRSADEERRRDEWDRMVQAKSVADRLSYVVDEKTGLCFAYTWIGDSRGGPAFTDVPCYPVEEYLKKKKGGLVQ